jgi:hypothetical protein
LFTFIVENEFVLAEPYASEVMMEEEGPAKVLLR